MTFYLHPLALFNVEAPEVMMILLVMLLLFGGKRLPELARGLGKSVREFKKAAGNIEAELKKAIEEAPETKPDTQKTPWPVHPSIGSGVEKRDDTPHS